MVKELRSWSLVMEISIKKHPHVEVNEPRIEFTNQFPFLFR